jgi:protein gp37
MNRTKIEWTDYTWNPVTGCLHGCNYCYARRLAEGRLKHKYPHGFKPTFWAERLDEPYYIKKPSKIFVCSMGDLFGDWVPEYWINEVLDIVTHCSHHTFQFLTKNPSRYHQFDFPGNAWLGITIDRVRASKTIIERIYWFQGLDSVRFISFEPLLDFSAEIAKLIFEDPPDWIIIGAKTGPNAVQPKREWVEMLIKAARKAGTAIFLKNNLRWSERIQEFPEGCR